MLHRCMKKTFKALHRNVISIIFNAHPISNTFKKTLKTSEQGFWVMAWSYDWGYG